MSFNEDDDFADFQNCTFNQEEEEEKNETNCSVVDDDSQDDDFADFQNANLVVNNDQNLTDTQFKSTTANQQTTLIINENQKFESILKDAFPICSTESVVDNVNKEDNQTAIIKEFFTDDYKQELWNQIQNLEESPSLKLKWMKTQSFQNFLSALRINPKNTLNPHVPVFASSLGQLLEPIRLKANNADEPKEHINHINNHHKQETNLIDNHSKDINCLSTNDKNLKSNSLKKLNNMNLICDDLDNFDSFKKHNDKSDRNVDGLMKPDSSYGKLIKPIKQPEKRSDEETNNKILDELPILGFMRSNTLMYNGQ